MRTLAFVFPMLLALGPLPAVAQNAPSPAPASSRIQGTIAKISGSVLTVTTADGSRKVTLVPHAVVRVATQADAAAVKPGAYIGAAAEPQPDGTLQASEIEIFPPALAAQKVDEGFRFTAQGTLTDATVTAVNDATSPGKSGKILTLTYPGGEKQVLMTPQTRVITYVDADTSALKPGAKVVITGATPSGDGYTASALMVGRNGVDPM